MKRLAVVLLAVAVLVMPLMSAFAQQDLRATDPFWNPTDENFAAWRVVDGVEEGAELTFWTMSLSPTFDEYINKIVENFEATYPEVNVTWEDQPWDQLQEKTRNAFAAGDPPDVINLSPAWVGEFAEAGLLMDMDAAMEAYPDIREQYSDGAWNTLTYEGVSYQVPWYLGLSNFIGYNTAILDELGITVEDLPTSWAELYDFLVMVRENSDYYGTSLNFGTGIELNLLGYLQYNDVPVFNEEGKCALNTGTAAADLQLWVDMINNDLIPRESLTDDHRAMVDRFSEGETAVIRIAPHMLRLVEENNPDMFTTNLGVAPGITGTSGANQVDVQSLVVPAAAEYPNAALALALFVTNPEAQAAFAKEVGIFPSNLLSYQDPFFTTTEDGNPVSAVRPLALDYVTNAENRTVSFPNDAEVQQAIVDAQNQALLGEKTPQQALDDLCTQIDSLIAAAE
jgi:putative chitobiose transport system substrate-binding protein